MPTLQIFKFLGIFVSFASGVLATAFETKQANHLNQTGMILLTFIILGSVVSALIQFLEDQKKAADQAKADAERASDVRRLSFIIKGTERLAHRLEPLEWRAVIRYRVDRNSVLWSYAARIRTEHPGTTTFDLVDEFRPRRNEPPEEMAWDYLIKPPVYVAVLKHELLEREGMRLPIPIMHGVSLLLDATRHADPEASWKPGPNATSPPFYSRMSFHDENGILWLRQDFVIRNSPEAVRALGVISPVDLSGLFVVAEAPQDPFSIVEQVVFVFPTAHEAIEVDMKATEPVMGWNLNRAVALLDPDRIRTALGLLLEGNHRTIGST